MNASQVRPGILVWLFAATIFLSAFLLFQVQPMISKYILLVWLHTGRLGHSPAVLPADAWGVTPMLTSSLAA